MKRQWKLLAGVPLALVLILWGLGIIGSHAPSRGTSSTPAKSPSPRTADEGSSATDPKGKLEFSAAFAGSTLDTNVWGTCYPAMDLPAGCTNFGNKEYQWYLGSQDRVADGELRLVASRVPTAGTTKDGGYEQYDCRSGMVTTYSSFHFEYGYMQVVAKIPDRPGLWPGLWLAAEDGVWPPEIDLIEAWGATNGRPESAGAYFHPAPIGTPQVRALLSRKQSVGWHKFGLLWTKSELVWSVDGKTVLTVRQRVPHEQMYFIADLAEFTEPTLGACSGTLAIRSVKVWSMAGPGGS